MNKSWSFLKDCQPLEDATSDRVEHVLVAYDGPAILSLIAPDGIRLIAVAVDEDDGIVRWVQCPIQTLEWKALIKGSLGLYDTFALENTVQVVDRTPDGKAIRGWKVLIGHLTKSDYLPDPGALLPTETLLRFGGSPAQESPGQLQLREVLPSHGSHTFPRVA